VSETLTESERKIWRSALLLADLLRFRVASEIKPVTSLTSAEHSVLLHLFEAPGQQLGQQALADEMFWSKSRMSHQLTRMQGRGLVVRTSNRASNGVRISLAAAGKEIIEASADAHAKAIRRYLLDAGTDEELAVLVTLADRIAGDPTADRPH
jgi:DNA-binding MarR family transcriptional regulator